MYVAIFSQVLEDMHIPVHKTGSQRRKSAKASNIVTPASKAPGTVAPAAADPADSHLPPTSKAATAVAPAVTIAAENHLPPTQQFVTHTETSMLHDEFMETREGFLKKLEAENEVCMWAVPQMLFLEKDHEGGSVARYVDLVEIGKQKHRPTASSPVDRLPVRPSRSKTLRFSA